MVAPYTGLVRSYSGTYAVTLQLDIEPGDREIVENAEDFVNFKVQHFFSAIDMPSQTFSAKCNMFSSFYTCALFEPCVYTRQSAMFYCVSDAIYIFIFYISKTIYILLLTLNIIVASLNRS